MEAVALNPPTAVPPEIHNVVRYVNPAIKHELLTYERMVHHIPLYYKPIELPHCPSQSHK